MGAVRLLTAPIFRGRLPAGDLIVRRLACAIGCATALSCGGGGGDSGGTADDGTSVADESQTGPSSSNSNSNDGTESESDDGGAKFDVGPDDNCEPGSGCGEVAYSYIWIASPDGHVSKINTQSVQEEGRYLTAPAADGDPSRTSVNLTGAAVVVANRKGGLAKFWNRIEDCEESNGQPGIQTSQGANDILAWDEEECRAWYNPFEAFNVQRPVAWAPGEINQETCAYENEYVWTSGCPDGDWPGFGGGGPIYVHQVDGETGEDLGGVEINETECFDRGPYGGAVDANASFWTHVRGKKELIRVDPDLTYEWFPIPENLSPYGITVDSKGRPWVSAWPAMLDGVGGGVFDPETETWTLLDIYDFSSLGGLAEAPDGRMWIATMPFGAPSPDGAVWFDVETLALGDQVTIPNTSDVKGISIDSEGYIWAVSLDTAYKIDPDDYSMDSYSGLAFSYTYSDMTGAGLSNAVCPPAG